MPRKPEPWYMSRRKAWFVQLDKKQVKLGDDPDPRPKKKPLPPEPVMREYYRVMAVGGRTTESERIRATVAEVCEIFLEAKAQTREKTQEGHAYFLNRFAAPLVGREFRTIRKDDIVQTAESQPRWNETTKHSFIARVLILYRWAREAGYLEFNPLAGWGNPYAAPPRKRGMTKAEFQLLIDHSPDMQFKNAMAFLKGTGCRPGEMRVVEARHLDPKNAFITLEWQLHKTGRRTKKVRRIGMPKVIETMVRSLALRYPTGPIFRNSIDDTPWGKGTIAKRVRDYRRKLGLSEDVVPYLIRHATLSAMMNQGTSAHITAKAGGHQGTSTLEGV